MLRKSSLAALFGALLICDAAARSQVLEVGKDPGSNETVVIDSGTYDIARVGIAGNGTLINNGAFLYGLVLGTASNGVGTYIQNGASAAVIDPGEIGAMYGSGHVIQNAGTAGYPGGEVILSFHTSGDATYTLNGGTLISGETSVGSYTQGTFMQTGGLHQTDNLSVGIYSGMGTYLLSGGTLQVSRFEDIGHSARFVQSGGLNIAATLVVGSEGNTFPANFTFSGGTLLTGSLDVGPAQSFIQTGGVLSINNAFSTLGGDARFGNTAWGPGSTFETYSGVQTLSIDSGSSTARNLSMTLRPFRYGGTDANPIVVFESSQHLASLTIYAGSVTLTPGGDKVLETDSLTVGGKVDLNDNELRWDYLYNGPNPIGIVRNLLASARYAGGGVWKGGGITSSMADATTFGLGYWNKFDYVDVKRAFYGDANGDGVVDVTDLGAFASNWQSSNKFWADGDFNYDGVIDVTDLGLLAGNWQAGNASLDAALAALGLPEIDVPEPLCTAVVGSVMLLALRRRTEHRRR